MTQYTIKGLKTFRGMEGYGFNATLLRDGKPVAFVMDDANGGPYSYEWKDSATRRQFDSTVVNHNDEPVVAMLTTEEMKLWVHVRSLPKKEILPGQFRHVDPDMFLDGLINEAQTVKQVQRWQKSCTFVIGKDIKTVKGKHLPTPANCAKIRQTYPGAIVLAELSLDDAIAAVKRAGGI